MLTAKISSKGQLVVPKAIRNQLNIKPGAFFNVRIERNDIILTPLKASPVDRLYGKFGGESILRELEMEHANELATEDRT